MHKKINNCFISDFITRNVCCSINIPSKARTLLAFATFFFHAVLDCKLWICHPARRGEALLQTRTVLVPARLVLRRKLELVFDPEITTCVIHSPCKYFLPRFRDPKTYQVGKVKMTLYGFTMKGEVIKMLENHVGKGDSQNTTALHRKSH